MAGHRRPVFGASAALMAALLCGTAAAARASDGPDPVPTLSTRVAAASPSEAVLPVPTRPDCASYYVWDGVQAVTRDGARRDLTKTTLAAAIAAWKADTTQGRVFKFSNEGTVGEQVLPPANWDPVKATDRELEVFGVEPRPKDASLLREWEARNAGLKFADPAPDCSGWPDERYGLSPAHANDLSNIWSGGMAVYPSATTNAYRAASIQFVQPAFLGGCPGDALSDFAVWAGLGGYGAPLLQAGTAAMPSSLSGGRFWWEGIAGGPDGTTSVPPQFIIASNQPASGQTVVVRAYMNASGGLVRFSFTNVTTGVTTPRDFTSIGGQPAITFYDGSTAEWISETPRNKYLRRPSATFTIDRALVNDVGFSPQTTWRYHLERGGGTRMMTSYFDGAHVWLQAWNDCGFASE